MKVTKPELGQILNNGRRFLLLPYRDDSHNDRNTPQRLHRRGGQTVCYIRVTGATVIGPLDEWITDEYARLAGHRSAGEYRDEWCRTHDAAWTGQMAWEVSFTVEPWKEKVQHFRGPWDPGTEDRPRAPEGEPVDPALVESLPARMEAQQRWIKDRVQVEAAYFDGGITDRLDRALRDARENRIDTSSIERLIARKVTELERRNRRAA